MDNAPEHLTPTAATYLETSDSERIAYIRTPGARALLRAAELGRRAGKTLDGLRTWATEVQARMFQIGSFPNLAMSAQGALAEVAR